MTTPDVYTVTWHYKNGAALSQPVGIPPLGGRPETVAMEDVARRAAWAYRYSDHTPDDDYFDGWAVAVTVTTPDGGVYTLDEAEQARAAYLYS